MKRQVTPVCFLQSSKIVTVLYLIFGLTYWGAAAVLLPSGGNMDGIRIGIFVLGMPVMTAIFGSPGFAIFCAFYNTLAKFLDDFVIELKTVE